MKRNLISVIILAFSIINFILLAIIVFTVIPTNKKTANLITDIASIIDLTLESSNKDGEGTGEVSLDMLTPYELPNENTVTLNSTDGTAHYAVIKVMISMNSGSEDYKTYDPAAETGIASKSSIIESTIQDIVGSHSYEDCVSNKEGIRQECLTAVKKLFNDSDVIYDVQFSKWVLS
ncbi:MAG: flagellar basal body-associated FliL family protein [Lachnospiraceae bacterium]|nr:flagellar basal body-associated FliL family protein [Lachnospiraceae bacterium]